MDGTGRQSVEPAIHEQCADGFRHTFASHMMMRGANLGELKDILGHSDVKMTMRYAHLSPAHRQAAVARLDGLTPVAPVPGPAQGPVPRPLLDQEIGARREQTR